jgi:hypothetical protein
VAVAAFAGSKTITQIAMEIESSRKFVRGQKAIVAGGIDAAFHPEPTSALMKHDYTVKVEGVFQASWTIF